MAHESSEVLLLERFGLITEGKSLYVLPSSTLPANAFRCTTPLLEKEGIF